MLYIAASQVSVRFENIVWLAKSKRKLKPKKVAFRPGSRFIQLFVNTEFCWSRLTNHGISEISNIIKCVFHHRLYFRKSSSIRVKAR